MIFDFINSSASSCTFFFIYFANNKMLGSNYYEMDSKILKKITVPDSLEKLYVISTTEIKKLIDYKMLNICVVPKNVSYAKIYMNPDRTSISASSVILSAVNPNYIASYYNDIGSYITLSSNLCNNMINLNNLNHDNVIGLCPDLSQIELYIQSFNKNSYNQPENTTPYKLAFIVFIILVIALMLVTIGLFVFTSHTFIFDK